MGNPSDRGWGRPPFGRAVLLQVPCGNPELPMWVRREVQPLFVELVERVEAVAGDGFMTSSGGYNHRPMRGREKAYEKTGDLDLLSNHAWALAGDFRAGTNPGYSSRKTDFPPETSRIAASVGLAYGGDWINPYDPMHFEFLGTPGDAARWVYKLQTERILKGVLMGDWNNDEKAEILRAVRCINRAFDTKQSSLINPKETYWATQFLQFIDAATNRTEKKIDAFLNKK